MPGAALSTRIVGRDAELTELRAVLHRAAAGESAAVIIIGEPGIGKTALARAAYTGPDAPRYRLDVTCLPLQSLTTGLAPLRRALRASLAPAAPTIACLTRIDEGDPIRAVDDWVEDVAADGPLVVVVDDAQWADASLRDLVLYLLAGPRDRRLAVLVTARTTGLSDGDPFHRWLADALHFAQVSRLEVGALGRADTESLLADLLGSRPHQSLVEEVHQAAQGNPYLTSLLARNLDPTDRHLPTERPGDLVTAVKGAWHGCSAPTRALCALLAVGGAPERSEVLAAVVADLALDIPLGSAIVEAEMAGLLESLPGDRYWFRHPLQAEILERSVAELERRHWLAAYARRGDEITAPGRVVTLETAVAQSLRHDRAGSPVAAYRWAQRAEEIGRGRRGTTDLRRVLRRAIVLQPQVPDAAATPETLWQAVRRLAHDDGDYAEELEAVEALLAITDEVEHPLQASELLVRRMLLRMTAAVEFLAVDDMRRAVRLASADPSSWQYALALAELAHAGFWHSDPEAAAGAGRAVAAARAAGHPAALSFALTASAMLALDQGRFEDSRSLATEAVEAAAAARDWWAFPHAAIWESNAAPEPYGAEEADALRRRYDQLAALGGPQSALVYVAVAEIEARLDLGDWQACDRLLRETLVCDPGPLADLRARILAALLAAYQGRRADAVGHMHRAEELVGDQPRYRNLNLDAARATVLLTAGRPAEAYRTAVAAVEDTGVPVHMAERLVPLAAQALADQAEHARDHRQPAHHYLEQLDALHARFPTVIDPEDSHSRLWQQRIVAFQAWYDAESARARRDPAEPDQWVAMRSACVEGQLPWFEMYACRRAAVAILRRGRTGRAEGVRLLRAGHDLALRLGAAGTRSELEELGRLAHVDLTGTDARPLPEDPRLSALTPRERELLGYLVRGLTYAEIAETLVISEKTVSSHVSNLLRKTGTASRVELTRMVARTGS
jgi:DNA-binding CsgD family transcriptional regulator